MVRFIESAHGGQANHLLQAVLADLRDPVCIAGCRALGLIDKRGFWPGRLYCWYIACLHGCMTDRDL